MLYQLILYFKDELPFLNVLKYVTFRAMLAFLLTLIFVLYFQPKFIKIIQKKQFGQPIRDDGPQSHFSKKGTPTMGGVVIIVGIIINCLLWCDLSNNFLWATLFVTIGYAILGFMDDFFKVTKKNTAGVSARQKLFWQFLIAILATVFLTLTSPDNFTNVYFPFFKNLKLELGWFFIPFATLVIVGCSNAVNLTDGLDGLVIGPVMTVAFTYAIFAYVSSHVQIARYLQITHINGAEDLAIFASAMLGGGLGFLWYNSFPAQIFMGDVGALSLGGGIGTMAIITKQEIILPLAGGIFFMEALSVIAQVGSFKLRGKRVFRMAPIHHHFELKGLTEPKIIVRFWIISIVLAILSLSTLKLR